MILILCCYMVLIRCCYSVTMVLIWCCYGVGCILLCGIFIAQDDSPSRQSALESFNSSCQFNPEDNVTAYKMLSSDLELNGKAVGQQIRMFCRDGALRKKSTVNTTEFLVECKSVIQIDDEGKQTLHFYWDTSELKEKCSVG